MSSPPLRSWGHQGLLPLSLCCKREQEQPGRSHQGLLSQLHTAPVQWRQRWKEELRGTTCTDHRILPVLCRPKFHPGFFFFLFTIPYSHASGINILHKCALPHICQTPATPRPAPGYSRGDTKSPSGREKEAVNRGW